MELLSGCFYQSESKLFSFDFFDSHGYWLVWCERLSAHLRVVNQSVSLKSDIHEASKSSCVAYNTLENLADF